MDNTPENHPLHGPLMAAIHQAMYGKGERHGGASVPFMEQPIFHYAKMHGRGFLTGQAAKKLEEAASIKNDEAFIAEVLGAIVYAGAAVLFEYQKMEREKAQDVREAQQRAEEAETIAAIHGMYGREGHDGPGGPTPPAVRTATPEHRECRTCANLALDHRQWPCSKCADQPEVLPFWTRPVPAQSPG